ncbi:MAG TPA: hypothetical protein VNI61_07495 [Gemmatimonadales bacterium]|nr:hypothetical protein [Gemmatimonadales bacterium]
MRHTTTMLAVGILAAAACTDRAAPGPTGQLVPGGTTITVAATTTGSPVGLGSDLDPDGYVAWVDFNQSQPIAANGLAVFSGFGPGFNNTHAVALYDIASNCAVSTLDKGANNPRAVSAPEGVAATADFSVGCVPSGGLTVRTATTGMDLPPGYTLTVDGTVGAIAANGMVTFTELFQGEHSVALSGVPANCTLSGPASHSVTVAPGATTVTGFSASCAPVGTGSGTLTVITNSTGSDVPTAYSVILDGTLSQTVGAGDTVTFAVAAGAHPVELAAVPANCDVSGENPRAVSVSPDDTGSTTFAVACGPVQPRLTGRGQLGMASGTGQVFDFDLRADLTGRFALTDSSNVHPSGERASLFTDAGRDPETKILAYRNTSKACPDPGRGAEFDAVGRLDEGALRFYTVQLCDNGPAGSGTDFLSLYVPAEGYGRSGVVTSGDVAKR